ncbi:putative aquaporin [Neospora caninum Liverpool]|uniref:Aquaporin, putative n=1 Tax=Neospora caninum (strain Liverpool) TaxID=572307 RepID=F0VAW9_NEOCL|nr:putative aquaporin [Neospora caninum Liverpool]CBZ50827.1 putative aquaporin [Neospora caninum Liverpool]CEL68128.1 TPA: aquaporin, putative [Neospora caninum Liverpool]|eukprot:XP_003880860.1 putative aquaporin [Neospora caninum Liverpool]
MEDFEKKSMAAEFVGSFALLFAAELLSLFRSDLFSYGLALSLTYAVVASALHQFRGVQLNPILTLIEVFAGRIKLKSALMSMVLQFAGAALGASLAALICGESGILPAGIEGAVSSKILLAQLVFCTTLAFAHIETSADGGQLSGVTVALVTYAAYTATFGLSGYLNPAVALGTNIGNALQGTSINYSQFASFVVIPFLAAAAGWGAYKLSYDNLLMAEFFSSLSFTYCACCAMTGDIKGTNTAISIGCMAAALIYAIGWKSGGALNPAVTLGTLVSGHNRVADMLFYCFFQCGAGVLGAVLARYTMGPLGLFNILSSGNHISDLLTLLLFSMLLMAAYSLTFGDLFGRPAGTVIGAVYTAFHLVSSKALTLNVQTAFGIIISQLLLNGYAEDWGSAVACLTIPILGSFLASGLLSLLPSRYQRHA